MFHSKASLGARHPIHNWEYADATARTTAGGFVPDDIGKVAKQLDDDTLWQLTATTPTWKALGGNSHSHSNLAQLDLITDGDHDVRTDNPHSVTAAQTSAIPTSEKGAANGVCDLDAGGKVPASRLSLSNVLYKGTWNANTNTPTLSVSGGGGVAGDYYVVSVAGATNIDGITDWKVGDWIIHNGTVWEKADHTDAVSSVAGKTGAVTLDHAADLSNVGTNTHAQVDTHIASTANPHSVTAAQVGASATGHTHTHASTTGQTADDHHAKLHAADHGPAGADALKLDDLAAPDDNTDLNASTSKHGLLPKLGGGTTNFLRADGSWSAPSGAGSGVAVDYYAAVQATVNTSATTLTLDTTRKSDAAFTRTANEITCNTAGDYRIDYDVAMLTEALNGDVEVWLEKNAAEVAGTRSKAHIDSNSGSTTAHGVAVLTLAATDVLRIRASSSTTAKARANGVRLVIHSPGATGATGAQGPTGSGSNVTVKDEGTSVTGTPHSNLNFTGAGVTVTDEGAGQCKIDIPGGGGGGSGVSADYYSTAQTSITTSATTVGLNTTRKSDAAFTLSGNQITCNTAGTYRIDADVSFGDTTAGNRAIHCWLEKNSVEIAGTKAEAYHETSGQETTAHTMAIVVLAVNDVIRIRATSDNTINTLANGTRLLIHTPGANGATGAQGPTGSGSNVTVKDEGTSVTGTPHSNLNFTGAGVTVTDEGGGQAKVDIPGSSALTSSEAGSATDTTTTSSVYVAMNSMSLTPGAGTYLVIASTSVEGTFANSYVRAALFANGSEVANTMRESKQESSIINTSMPLSTQAVVTVGAAQAIELRWKVTGGTATAHARSLTLVKIG